MIGQETLWITIFAIEQENGTYANLLTCVRNTIDFPLNNWRKISNKRNVHKFEACFYKTEGNNVIEQITTNQTFTILIEEKIFTFTFGELLRRNPVFIPYSTYNSVANGWWPGTLQHGFWLNEWYSMDSITHINPNIFKWIQKQIGFNLERLQDFTSTVIQIQSLETHKPAVHYNPDYQELTFVIHGEKTSDDHRVVIQLWEGKEAIHHEMIDLPKGIMNVTIVPPFKPTKIGYELYRQTDNTNWKLIAAANHIFIQQIIMNLGIISGKVQIQKNNHVTERDIVYYQKPTTTGKIDTPWVEAEAQRIRMNKSLELRELGSIFVRYNGSDTKKRMQQIIKNQLYEEEHEKIYIWDPYVNDEVIKDLLEYAIASPNLDIRILLSECGKQSNVSEITSIDQVEFTQFQRSNAIATLLKKYNNQPLENIKIRNWFRSKEPTFHDRFIITSKGVWHLGSSIKDIGNYHSTIYRMEDGLAKQIEQEFELAWDGNFAEMNPYGFSISSTIQWISKTKGE